MDINKIVFGKKIIQLRESKGLTRYELADILKIEYPSLSKYETDVRTPSPEIIKKMAEYFEVSIDFFYNHLTPKVEKKPKDLQKILEQHEVMFGGLPLTEEDKQAIFDIVELKLYRRAKELNKRKPREI
jgi:transcriptional regulator with XRE-family HTH domain